MIDVRLLLLEERWLTYADRRGNDECWPWRGYVLRSGHGQIRDSYRRKYIGAHRAAYEIKVGPIPRGMLVYHRCNNARCVNPRHLYVGTARDNARDAIRAGTFRYVHPGRGEQHHSAKLDAVAAVEIIRRHRNGETLGALAKEYGVSHSAASKVWRRETWKHA